MSQHAMLRLRRPPVRRTRPFRLPPCNARPVTIIAPAATPRTNMSIRVSESATDRRYHALAARPVKLASSTRLAAVQQRQAGSPVGRVGRGAGLVALAALVDRGGGVEVALSGGQQRLAE